MLEIRRQLLRFDGYTIDPLRGVVRRGDAELTLRRQSFEVLQYLADRPHQVVSSEDLISAIWTVKPADPNASVSQCIREIRRAMGDDARWIIKTVSGRGYEFMAEVVRLAPRPRETSVVGPANLAGPTGSPEAAVTPANAGGPQPPPTPDSLHPRWRQVLRPAVTLLAALIAGCWLLWPLNRQPATRGELTMMAAPTVAVLPFKVLGASGSQNDVASAFSEELRSELGRAVRGFDLIIKFATDQRDRPVASKADGARLGVRYLVLGTTWLERDIQHGNVRLVESSTEGQVWSEPFEFAPGEAGALNRTAARTARLVIVQLRTAESRRPLPANPEAGHFALLGNNFRESHRGSKSALEAESLFEKALAIDPNSIRALQGYAETRIAQVRNGWIPAEQWPAALAQAKGAIERTIRYDPNNVQGHYLRGALLREVGDVDQAIATFEYVLSLNPSYAMAQAHLGRIKIDAGRADEAIEHLKEAILLSPAESNVYLYYFWVGMAVLHLGDDRAAVQWLLKAREADRDYPFTALLLAVAYLGVGEVEKARTSISDFLKDMPRYSIEGWRKGMPPRNPVVAGQRKRIEDALRRLGVAEGRPVSAQH